MKKIVLFAAIMLAGAVQFVNAQDENNDCGTFVIPAIYDKIEPRADGLFLVTKEDKEGVLNSEGKIIVPIEFDYIRMGKLEENWGGLIVAGKKIVKEDKHIYSMYNKDGVLLVPMNKYYDISIKDGCEGLAKVSILIKEFNDTSWTLEGDSYDVERRVKTKDGVLLKNGKLLDSYDNYSIERGGLIIVGKDGKKGVLNQNGEVVIPIQYEKIYIKGKGLDLIEVSNYQKGWKFGLFNFKGEMIVPVGKYESISVGKYYIQVESNGKKGLLNSTGKVILPIGAYPRCSENKCRNENSYYVGVSSNNKNGAVNDNGQVFVPIGKYEYFDVVNEKLAIVRLNGKSGIVNRNGTFIIPIGKYDNLKYEYGVFTYSQNGKYGIIDNKGNQATSAEYDDIKPERHSPGLAFVSKGDKVGVIDCNGKTIIPIGEYVKIFLQEGIITLRTNEGESIHDQNGKEIVSKEKYEKCLQLYDKFVYLNQLVPQKLRYKENLFIVILNNKFGIVKL